MVTQKRLTHLTLENYRSVRSLDIELSPLTAFIGPNGSGKSNVLSAIRFLSTTARFDLVRALDEFGGFRAVHRDAKDTLVGDPVKVAVSGVATQHASRSAPDEYELEFSRPRDAARVTRTEVFRFKRSQGQGRRREIKVSGAKITARELEESGPEPLLTLGSAQTTGLFAAQVVKAEQDDMGGVAKFAEFLQSLVVLELNVNRIIRPARTRDVPEVPANRLQASGANLAAVIEDLRDKNLEGYAELVQEMKGCLPGFIDIEIRRQGGPSTFSVVQIVERGARRPYDLADASFGTVRMLALLTALHQVNPPPVMAIEEVDNGLHPYALDVLVDRMRVASARTQLLISSHSPTLVNRLASEEIIVCDRDPDTGESVIPAVGSAEIQRAVDAARGPGAGELWFAGVLDGVPRGA